ncbi:MAG TPA: DUF1206 domain-containing protein [Cytophagaceae bacterium]
MDTHLTHIEHQKWVENFSRFGIFCKGVVYCVLGLLAFLAAIGSRKQDPSKEGSFKLILEQPFGKILLAIVAIGLVGYVLWRFIQVVKDTENKGKDLKGIIARVGFGMSGIIYAGFAYVAADLVLGNTEGSGGGGNKQMTQKLLDHSYGQVILGIIALIVIGQAINQIYKAYTGKYKKKIHQERMSSKESEVFSKVGKVGYVARGIVLAIIGYFILRAALESNSNEVKDTEGAFAFINHSFGPVIFGIVALGLMAYGVFMFFMARYREI